jgi:hypothetical protein
MLPATPALLMPIDQAAPPTPGGIPTELIAGLFGIGALITYGVLYLHGAQAVDRYQSGFVVDVCPVCRQGHLVVENKQERILGIPRPRRIVRCTNCRSTLREAGTRRWRYAVDRLDSPLLYERLNGQILDEDTLKVLSQDPTSLARFTPGVKMPPVKPQFIDDEERK